MHCLLRSSVFWLFEFSKQVLLQQPFLLYKISTLFCYKSPVLNKRRRFPSKNHQTLSYYRNGGEYCLSDVTGAYIYRNPDGVMLSQIQMVPETPPDRALYGLWRLRYQLEMSSILDIIDSSNLLSAAITDERGPLNVPMSGGFKNCDSFIQKTWERRHWCSNV